MDILIMIEDNPEQSPVLAHVNSVPSSLDSDRASRDVVTLYGPPTSESLALALAAAVESHRLDDDRVETIRHLGIWPDRGAIGDAAWRDASGHLVSRDVDIPLETLRATAAHLIRECGQLIHRMVAGLSMPDWPEGARRAITFPMTPFVEITTVARVGSDGMLDTLREADGLTFEYEGD